MALNRSLLSLCLGSLSALCIDGAAADSGWDRYLAEGCPAVAEVSAVDETLRAELLAVAVARLEVTGLDKGLIPSTGVGTTPSLMQIADPHREELEYRCALRVIESSLSAPVELVLRLMTVSQGSGSISLPADRRSATALRLVRLFGAQRQHGGTSIEVVRRVFEHSYTSLGDMLLAETGEPDLLVQLSDTVGADGAVRIGAILAQQARSSRQTKDAVCKAILALPPSKFDFMLVAGGETLVGEALPVPFIEYLYGHLGDADGTAQRLLRGAYQAGARLSRDKLVQASQQGTLKQRREAFELLVEANPLASVSLGQFKTFIQSSEPELIRAALGSASKLGFPREVKAELVSLVQRISSVPGVAGSTTMLPHIVRAFSELRFSAEERRLVRPLCKPQDLPLDEASLALLSRQSRETLQQSEILLKSGSVAERKNVAWILGRLVTTSPQRLKLLVAAVADAEAEVRWQASESMGLFELSPQTHSDIIQIPTAEALRGVLSVRLAPAGLLKKLPNRLSAYSCAELTRLVQPVLTMPDPVVQQTVRQALFTACQKERVLGQEFVAALDTVGTAGLSEDMLWRVSDRALQLQVMSKLDSLSPVVNWAKKVLQDALADGRVLPGVLLTTQGLPGDERLQQAALDATKKGPPARRLRALGLYRALGGAAAVVEDRLVDVLKGEDLSDIDGAALGYLVPLSSPLIEHPDRRVVVSALLLLAATASEGTPELSERLLRVASRDDSELKALVAKVFLHFSEPADAALPVLEEFFMLQQLLGKPVVLPSERIAKIFANSQSVWIRGLMGLSHS